MRNLFAMILAATVLSSGIAHADQASYVHAVGGWIRLLPGGLPAGAYVSLRNDGDSAATLRSASSPSYAQAMLHLSSTDGGMGRMSMVQSAEIPAHGQLNLTPGGYHLMLLQATAPVKLGQRVRIRLSFDDGSILDADFAVQPAHSVGPAMSR